MVVGAVAGLEGFHRVGFPAAEVAQFLLGNPSFRSGPVHRTRWTGPGSEPSSARPEPVPVTGSGDRFR